jgi:hypothetical protein
MRPLVKLWVEREFPKIQALAKKEKAAIFFGDESGCDRIFTPERLGEYAARRL